MTSLSGINEGGLAIITDEEAHLLVHDTDTDDHNQSSSVDGEDVDGELELKSEETENEEALALANAKNTIYGMVIVALGTGLFCSVGAVVQYHGGSVLELMLGRYIAQNLIAWVIWFVRRPAECHSWYGDPPYRANIWTRGVLYWLTTFCWWRGLEMVPIGDGEAILFLSPIVTVIAARLLLGEKLPKSFVFTLILTLLGLVFICQPEFVFSSSSDYEAMSWKGLLFLCGACLAWSGCCVLVRTAKDAHWLQLETVSTTQAIFIWTPLIILLNQFWFKSDDLSGGGWDFRGETFGIMAAVGTLGFGALMLNVIGYQIGDATKVAWMEYLDLVFAFLYQWLAFGEPPNAWEFIGCACLIGTCGIHLIEAYWVYLKSKWSLEEQEAMEDGQAVDMDMDVDPERVDDETQPLLKKTEDEYNSTNMVDMSMSSIPESAAGTDVTVRRKLKLRNLVERLAFFPSGADASDSASDLDHKK